MSKIIFPQPLNYGDKAIIISPSGNTEPLYIDTAKSVLQSWGLQTETATYAYQKYGRFGGTREQRLSDLQSAMDDKEIKLIFCSRGGYGVVQLLENINYKRIRQYPKWLVGFSDITALHLAFLKKGIASLHAPMARHLTEDAEDEAGLYLKEVLFSGNINYNVDSHPLNRKGNTEGRLFGGNLAVMCGLIGTPYFKIPPDGILFIEDIGEPAYKIDRMIWQLKLSGILKSISGLIVGRFADCEDDALMCETIYGTIKDMVSQYQFPVIFGFPVGHVKDNYPLIQGGNVRLSVNNDYVTLENTD